ncbi:MAG TPA: ATP-binding protein [Candidatus Elarobacter sp.]
MNQPDGAWTLQANARGFGFRINDAALAHNARRIFATYLRGHTGAGAECDAAELIFGEILGNVARHAPGTVEVTLRWNGPAAVLEIYDDGPGYEVAAAQLPDDEFSESSRGLFLVAAFGGTELRTYRTADGRNVTHVVLPVRKRRPPE